MTVSIIMTTELEPAARILNPTRRRALGFRSSLATQRSLTRVCMPPAFRRCRCTYCVACVGLRPWATIFDSALFLLVNGEGLAEAGDHAQLRVVVPDTLVLPLPLAAIPSGARAVIGQSCVDRGLILTGDLATLCPPPRPIGMSPALRGAVGPRRREEHMDALERAAGGPLDTPAAPPSVERLRLQAAVNTE